MHNLFISILDYLDGTPITANALIAQIGLLTVDPVHQGVDPNNPPGDLGHLVLHVSQLNRAPDATPLMHTLTQEIIVAINNAKGWLQKVRIDARNLFYMTLDQLAQPAARTVLDDLVTQATYAYIGQLDSLTDTVKPAVLEAHYDVQKLATFDITKDVPKSL